MWGAVALRAEPSTHSTYAVTESRRAWREAFRIRRRAIFSGSSTGTNISRSSSMPRALLSKRL